MGFFSLGNHRNKSRNNHVDSNTSQLKLVVKSIDERTFVKRTEYHNESTCDAWNATSNTTRHTCTRDRYDIANQRIMYNILKYYPTRAWMGGGCRDRGKSGSYERSFMNYAILCETKRHGHMMIIHKPTGYQSMINFATGCSPTFVVHTNDRSKTG